MRLRYIHFVPCSRVEAFLEAGWTLVAHYRTFGNNEESFILEWLQGGSPPSENSDEKTKKPLDSGPSGCYRWTPKWEKTP